MNQSQRKISQLPVDEIWEGETLVSTTMVRDLNSSDIADLLRSVAVRFVVADIGQPFQWIPDNKLHDFWKNEVKAHLADTYAARLEDSPDEYCYFASEWKSNTGATIVLLSKAH